MNCTQIWDPNDPKYPDPSPCTTTNIGKALEVAGKEFAQPPIRQQALWVVVLLTDGMANAGYFDAQGDPVTCPQDTWPWPPPHPQLTYPIYCNDGVATTRHAVGSDQYDADDFAYDMADFVGLPASQNGQNALIFSIGLGAQVRSDLFRNPDGKYPGEAFLQYAANQGRGVYYYVPDASKLREIFRKIAENIATRLTH
jgi:hypothetical protein